MKKLEGKCSNHRGEIVA